MSQMSALERRSATFSQRPLFRGPRTDELLPQQHRDSLIYPAEQAGTAAPSLTSALLAAFPDDFKAATETPFLRLAGTGKLSKHVLSKWLSQDRLYAETYICFITSLMARVDLPYSFVKDKSKSLRWRIIRLLTAALENIHRELDFFTSTAEKYELKLDWNEEDMSHAFMPNSATQQYIDLFKSFHTDPSLPLIEGMVVLWATEQCYLSAWNFAASFTHDKPGDADEDGGALRQAFIPNWTSHEFHEFVDDIAELTNLLAEREQATKKLEVYKAVWSHVLDIEKSFWPVISDSTSVK